MVRRLATGLVITLVTLFVAAAHTAPPAPNTPTAASGKYGVNQDLAWDPPGQGVAEIQLMRAAGVQWLRMPLRWHWLEPQPGRFKWDRVDPVVDRAAGAGLKLLAVLGGTPTWASGVPAQRVTPGSNWDGFAPVGDREFADYVARVVEHFRGRVQAYELFNEPNSPNHWQPEPDARRFVDLLCAGYRAARRADPGAVIVAGGLNGNGVSHVPVGSSSFLDSIYAGRGARCFDVLAIHPFAHPTEDELVGLQAWVDETRQYMRARGDRRELWLTEVGWSSGERQWGHSTISEASQAAWVEAVYHGLHGAQKVFWYNFKDVRANPSNPEFQWGWLRYDLRPKAAYWSFAAMAK
jgi:hypothetical protein